MANERPGRKYWTLGALKRLQATLLSESDQEGTRMNECADAIPFDLLCDFANAAIETANECELEGRICWRCDFLAFGAGEFLRKRVNLEIERR